MSLIQGGPGFPFSTSMFICTCVQMCGQCYQLQPNTFLILTLDMLLIRLWCGGVVITFTLPFFWLHTQFCWFWWHTERSCDGGGSAWLHYRGWVYQTTFICNPVKKEWLGVNSDHLPPFSNGTLQPTSATCVCKLHYWRLKPWWTNSKQDWKLEESLNTLRSIMICEHHSLLMKFNYILPVSTTY